MTRKHFKAFAAALSTIENITTRRRIADLIGQVFAQNNPRFNWSTFYMACGLLATVPPIRKVVNNAN